MAGSILSEKVGEAGLEDEHNHPLNRKDDEKEEEEEVTLDMGRESRRAEKAEEADEGDTEIRDPLEPENDMQSIEPSAETSIESQSPPAEKHSSKIPNGGLNAWLQVAGSFVLFMNTWGIANTYGVYQTFYQDDLLSDHSPSSISWIGSFQAFLLLIIGVFTGPLYDAGFFRELLWAGSFLTVFSLMMTSLCTEYWQVFLAQGLALGLGLGLLFIPSVAIVSQYFDTKKALAMGIAASGSSLGGVIYPIIFHRLQPSIGFGWSTRVLGFLTLVTFILPLMVMKVRLKPAAKRPLVDWDAFKEPPFVLYSIAVFLGFIGLYTPFYYLPSYSVTKAGTTAEFSIYTISIANAASTFGRIFPNYLADKTGPINMMAPCAIISAIIAYCWMAMKTEATVIVFALLYGFFTGSFVSLPPTCIVTLSPHLGIVGTRMGMVFTCSGLGLLMGTPVAGAILGDGASYVGIQVFCASLLVASGIFLIFARIAKTGTVLMSRA
ncbi:hypothetical protein B7463_g8925, partial [Scytalidium lignicola]